MPGKEKNGNGKSLKKISLIVGIVVGVLVILGYCGTVIYKAATANAQIATNTEACIEHDNRITVVEKSQSDIKIHTEYMKAQVLELKENQDKFQVEMKSGMETLRIEMNQNLNRFSVDIKELSKIIMRQHGG